MTVAVTRTFPAKASLKDLVIITNSLGAHVAAKLDHFASDERTLTDDLCDMFYIWARKEHAHSHAHMRGIPDEELKLISLLPDKKFDVSITKTTQQEEATVGADFALKVTTPLGVKRALMQAKVYDPQDDKLRCDSLAGWDKLWGQLVLMRSRSNLSFFLIYVPACKLNRATQGIGTWEQQLHESQTSLTSSKFGVSLISADQLLDNSNNWRFPHPLIHVGNGKFRPKGISLTKLLIDMLLCRQGVWTSDGISPVDQPPEDRRDVYPVNYLPYREISISFDNLTADEWLEVTNGITQNIGNLALT
jgi:hypothetical protein